MVALCTNELLPCLAQYHQQLKIHHPDLEVVIENLDFAKVYEHKFVNRVTKDQSERERLVQEGNAILTYLSQLPRQAIHNDLHATNGLISPTGAVIIDPEDAVMAHTSLDTAHLLYDPAFGFDHGRILLLQESYRTITGHASDEHRRQDIAGTWFKLCLLVGRGTAYNRPKELAWHTAGLHRATLDVAEVGIPGVDRNGLQSILRIRTKD